MIPFRPFHFPALVLLLLGTSATKCFATSADPIQPGSWSLAILPDTQHYALSYPATFTAQTQWIKDHKLSHNIQYTLHLGDVVDGNTVMEWNRAKTSMSVLDGFVPYAMTTGNKDYGPNGNATTRDTLFNSPTYFGPGSFYASQASVKGFYQSGTTDNSYHTFRVGNQEWLILALEFGPRDGVVDWANDIVNAHPNHHAILVTHAYLYQDSTLYDWNTKGTGQHGNPHSYGIAKLPGGISDGQELWDKLVSKHDNFRLVFSGHVGSGGYLAKTTEGGTVVHQLLSDYQSRPNGGEGYLRYIEFSPSGDSNTVTVRTYSPTLGQHLRTPGHEFSFSVQTVPEPCPAVLVLSGCFLPFMYQGWRRVRHCMIWSRFCQLVWLALVANILLRDVSNAADISHGPMLGAVGEDSASIWLRTDQPAQVTVQLSDTNGLQIAKRTFDTIKEKDFTVTARFNELQPDRTYRYFVAVENSTAGATFSTLGPRAKTRPLRMVFGSCYKPGYDVSNPPVFQAMAAREADLVLFLGDFPYTKQGERDELRHGHQEIRARPGFRELTQSTPTYAIWDDHDFGKNNTDGRHRYAKDALQVFKEYWANFSFGDSDQDGIYDRFLVGEVEIFLLDGRYHSRQDTKHPTHLGNKQREWLYAGLKQSKARYKLLVSGTPFTRVNNDAWGGAFYIAERNALLHFIRANNITGVVGISGDIHRVDVHRLPLKEGEWFYDFSSSPMAQKFRKSPPPEERDLSMIYSHAENQLFGELEFNPSEKDQTPVTFRVFSPGQETPIHEYSVPAAELGLKRAKVSSN